jgi:hypothetical protein
MLNKTINLEKLIDEGEHQCPMLLAAFVEKEKQRLRLLSKGLSAISVTNAQMKFKK